VHKIPLIPFVSKVKKVDKVVGSDTGMTELIKLGFLMDSDKPDSGSKYYQQFATFKDGCQVEWNGLP
jgi:hypothetical protein